MGRHGRSGNDSSAKKIQTAKPMSRFGHGSPTPIRQARQMLWRAAPPSTSGAAEDAPLRQGETREETARQSERRNRDLGALSRKRESGRGWMIAKRNESYFYFIKRAPSCVDQRRRNDHRRGPKEGASVDYDRSSRDTTTPSRRAAGLKENRSLWRTQWRWRWAWDESAEV